MSRPLLIRLLPRPLRAAAWWRLYRGKHDRWLPLYKAASLHSIPQVKMELVPGDIISDCIAFTGLYEPAVTQRVLKLAHQGGILIDVGANLGYFSLLWTACNPRNRSIAFEASPRIIEFLRRNVNQNGLEGQVEIIPFAAGQTRGKFRFDVGPAEQTGWGGFTLGERSGSIEVEVIRIDEVVRSHQPIALLKVDIEGADAWALMGCERLLRGRLVREIWYEQNKPRMQALGIPLDAPQEYLRSVGYSPSPQGNPSSDLVEWSATPT